MLQSHRASYWITLSNGLFQYKWNFHIGLNSYIQLHFTATDYFPGSITLNYHLFILTHQYSRCHEMKMLLTLNNLVQIFAS